MFYIFGFYKFKKLTRILSFKNEFNIILKKNSARGSIIISTEGLNGIISGEKNNILKIIRQIKKFYNFTNFDSQNSSLCLFQPFHTGTFVSFSATLDGDSSLKWMRSRFRRGCSSMYKKMFVKIEMVMYI